MKNSHIVIGFLTCYLLLASCGLAQEAEMLELPDLTAITLDGEPLNVVATTSIIGDVVSQVGGDAIKLTTLIKAGQDPHAYEPVARDLASVSKAHVVFINGWDLEENFLEILEEVSSSPLVPVSANLVPLEATEHHDHEKESEAHDDHDEQSEHAEHAHHDEADPHTWQSIHNVVQWVKNIQQVLTTLDPAQANTYEANAAQYLDDLEKLALYAETELAKIPAHRRFIVSNHSSFAYLANDYDLEVIGTIIPSSSTLAEPSAADLVDLVEELRFHNLCTLFTETTVTSRLAQTVANELSDCETVQILPLYTGALGEVGSGADSYIMMMRSNIDTLVLGLAD